MVGVAAAADEDAIRESFIHIEVDRQGDRALLEELPPTCEPCSTTCGPLSRTGGPCSMSCTLWSLWRRTLRRSTRKNWQRRAPSSLAGRQPLHLPRIPGHDLVREDGEDAIPVVVGVGDLARGVGGDDLAELRQGTTGKRRLARQPNPLNLTKANSVSTVRPARLPRLRRRQAFRARWRGDRGVAVPHLYTSIVYNTDPGRIPCSAARSRW